MAAPSSDFESADYPALRACSLTARGLWTDMRYLMRQSRRFGYLYQEGKPLSLRQLAQTTGCHTDEARPLLQELIDAEVCAVAADNGCYYSPRMVAFESFRRTCALAGKRGGNPILLEGSSATLNRTPKGRSNRTSNRSRRGPPDSLPISSPETPPLTQPSSPPILPAAPGGDAATAGGKPPGVGSDEPGKGKGDGVEAAGVRLVHVGRNKPGTPQAELFEHFLGVYQARYGRPYPTPRMSGNYAIAVKVLEACIGCMEDAKRAVEQYVADDWFTVNRHNFPAIQRNLPKYIIPADSPGMKPQSPAATNGQPVTESERRRLERAAAVERLRAKHGAAERKEAS